MPEIAIVGGGLSGLSAAWFIHQAMPDLKITLFESEDRLGGKIRSGREQGFLYETGPNGFMNSRKEILQLCMDLGLEDRLVSSNEDAAERYVMRKGKLKRLPKKPPQIFTGGFLSIPGKLRLLCEPFIKKSLLEDESLYEFAKRRLGKEVAEFLIDPFTSGVFGADCRKLSVRSAMPLLREMEQEHGSLFKAIKAKMKANKGQKPGKLTSLKEGMEELSKALQNKLADAINFQQNSHVTSVSEGKTISFIFQQEEKRLTFNAVILACPASATSKIIAKDLPELSQKIRSIPYSAITVAPQGYSGQAPDTLKAFGYLVPSAEPAQIMGTLFSSSIFPGRAPENCFSLRTMLGGGKDPDIMKKSDEEILELIKTENRQTLGIDKKADFVKLISWPEAIPRYEAGHWKIVEELEKATAQSALFVTGNAFYGVSMNDCIVASMNLSKRLKSFLESQ
jgi:protoporphyrinogen/coproporphyrinogen III oxidase